MPLVVKDRVRETSTTTGTGTITLGGAVSNFQSFSAIGDGNTTYYTITLDSAGEWEVGIGTYTASGTTLSRDVVLESSNGGTLVPFSAGTKNVFCTYPAETSVSDGKTNVIEVSSTDAALRITQLGTGNALLVEDDASPDATPLIVDSAGRLVVGYTSATPATLANVKNIQSHSTGGPAGYTAVRWDAGVNGPQLLFGKSRGGAVGTLGIVSNGDILGQLYFSGDDGTDLVTPGAQIIARVDGTPGVNDMPGRLEFYTTADGASTSTERMRIDSSGVTTLTGTGIINANSTTDALRITQTGTGNALVVEDEANPDSSPFVVNADGRVIVGTTQSAAAYGATTPYLQVRGTDISTSAGSIESNSTTASRGGTLFLARSRSTTIGGVTAVQSGDRLAAIAASGADGTGFIQAALITAEVDGTPGTDDMPGRLVFSTTADGASSPTERMRIDSAGDVEIGTQALGSSTDTRKLTVASNGFAVLSLIGDYSNTSGEPGGAGILLDVDGTSSVSGTVSLVNTAGTAGSSSDTYTGTTSNSLLVGTFGSGSVHLGTAGSVGATLTAANNFQFDSGYGSVATAYGCRAWVNFNGTGTVAIRESGNVSSITDNGTGNYTVNFTTAMPDANYCTQVSAATTSVSQKERVTTGYSTSAVSVRTSGGDSSAYVDATDVFVAIFR